MTLHAPFILLGLPRNHHMHHLPTSDITRSSQDQIKLGINNTVVIIKWPQGAWSLPTILAQYHEYPTTRYPRYHGDHSGDHNHDQHLVSNGDLSGAHNHDQLLVSNIKMVYPPSSSQQCDVHNLVCKINLNVDPWCDLLSSVSITVDSAIDRFNTLCRGSALYPHHGTHGLALPFGWTNGVPTKPIYCHDTLPATPTHSQLG